LVEVRGKRVMSRRIKVCLLVAGLILALACLGYRVCQVWRIARLGLRTLARMDTVLALADDPAAVDPATLGPLVQEIHVDLVALRGEIRPLLTLASKLGWVPGVGPDLQALPPLLDIAVDLTGAGDVALEGLSPLLRLMDEDAASADGDSTLSLATHALVDARPQLETARALVERAAQRRAEVDATRLSPRLARLVDMLDRGLPLLQAGLEAAMVAPDLLGVEQTRTYLVLALNEDELRPVGGFISGVGEVTVQAGQLITMTFRDSYAVDDFSQPYPDPPEPLRRYMGIELWVFRDSNWSPDFPSTVRRAISLYRPDHPVSVDGVIALDQQAVRGLVEALGPLSLEGVEEPLTGETVVAYVRQAWAPEDGDLTGEWWRQRKSFMGSIADAAWRRVQRGQVDWVALAQVVLRLLDEKHLLVYVRHPSAAALLAEQGWDGSLRSGPGDFLMVVDANMGYNKANARVQEALDYRVDLGQSPPRASLTLVYTHTSHVDYPCRHENRYGQTYKQMINRCYWDYLRVYVPQGSRLLDATYIPILGEKLLFGKGEPSGEVISRPAEEGEWLSFEVMSLLPLATSQTRAFTWTLPADVVQWMDGEGSYHLRVQKQPGTRGYPLTVHVRLPEGVVLLEARPEPAAVCGEWLAYHQVLEEDREFWLRFGRE